MKWTKKLEDRIYDRVMDSLEQRLDGCARLFLFTKEQAHTSKIMGRGYPIGLLHPLNANSAIHKIANHLDMEFVINEEKRDDVLFVKKS